MPVNLDDVEAVEVPECVDPQQLVFVDGGHVECRLRQALDEARAEVERLTVRVRVAEASLYADDEIIAEHKAEVEKLREAGQELVDAVDALASFKEAPDSFTTQPMRAALRGDVERLRAALRIKTDALRESVAEARAEALQLREKIRKALRAQRDGKWALVDALLSEALGGGDEAGIRDSCHECGEPATAGWLGKRWCSRCLVDAQVRWRALNGCNAPPTESQESERDDDAKAGK